MGKLGVPKKLMNNKLEKQVNPIDKKVKIVYYKANEMNRSLFVSLTNGACKQFT
jgi:hypothetical protein